MNTLSAITGDREPNQLRTEIGLAARSHKLQPDHARSDFELSHIASPGRDLDAHNHAAPVSAAG